MKKILAFLLPILILSVTFALLAVPSSAASTDEVGYAVWNSEADYLANPNKPVAKYETAALTTDKLTGRGYVLCYSDVLVSSQVQLDRRQNIIINLNGHKMTASSKIIVNGSSAPSWLDRASLTIKNGTIEHVSSQFIQPRPNSEIYFENLHIIEKSKSGNFIYDAGVRIIHFKNTTFEVAPECSGIAILSLSAAYTAKDADKLKPKEEDGTMPDYERNVIFEDSYYIDNSTTHSHKFIYAKASTYDVLNISFANGSGFNFLDDTFLVIDNPECVASVNISKGARFKEQNIPVNATTFSVNYYDSIEVYGDNKNFVKFGNEVQLLTSGEQDPDNPELIWGNSGDPEYPHQLCQYLCNVTWNINGVETRVEGYADGLKIRYPAEAAGYYSEDGKVYLDIHDGWSKNEDGSDWEHTVTVTDKEVTYYAVFSKGEVTIVEYSSSDMSDENIIGGIIGDTITKNTFNEFSENSYIRFYKDVHYDTDEKIVIGKSLTLDLGGYTFYKDLVFSHESAALEILDGVEFTIINGTVSSSRTSLAVIDGTGILNVGKDAVVLYDTAALIKINKGTVNFNGATVEHRTTDNYVPAILYTGEGGAATVNFTETTVNAAGALATYLPGAGAHEMTLNIKDCEYVGADSLFALYGTVADNITEGSRITFTMENSGAKTREVFEVPARSNGKTSLEGTYTIGEGCYLDAIPTVSSGEVVLPEGMHVLAVDHPIFSYTVAENDLAFKFNLKLTVGFTANFYVPTTEDVAYFESYLGRVDVADLAKTTIDGVEYYVGSVDGISVSNALDVISVKIGFKDAEGNVFAMNIDYDLVDYFRDLLSDDDPLVRKLGAAALTYVKAGYEYTSSVLSIKARELLASEDYLLNVRPGKDVIDRDDVDRGNIAVAFRGAQLYLSSDLALRLNIKEGFTGDINVLGTSYSVVDGKVGECTYIEISLGALELYMDVISITGTAEDGTAISGEYSLMSYVNAMENKDEALTLLLDSLFAYCYEAYVTYNGGVLPPYFDHTPPVDAELR